MAPILEMEVECGEQKSRLLRGMVVLRGTVNYCMCLAEGCGDGYERSDFHLVWHSRSDTCTHATISQPSLSPVPIATLANLIPRAIWQIGSELPPTLGVALGPDNFSYVTILVTLLAVTIMSLEAARDLSIPDLLRLLNEKLLFLL